MTAFVPTNVISITDGQIFLETDLFNAGIRPAINAGISVSRVGGAAQTKIMKRRDTGGGVRLALAQYRELAAFSQFASDLDVATQRLIARGDRLTELLKQPQFSPMPFEEQVISLFAGVRGYLEKVAVSDVGRFEQSLLKEIRTNHADIVKTIRTERAMSDAIIERLKKVIGDFAAKFA